ncbi:GNAT family N-acetyltransferase [Acuticoccus sediminis]|uniref:GNAT family N-acetyltransferase n=1 Tax=Acuticoccus sediminis TaxID=2184697 RepID=UPI001CFD6F4E|nr:GNAT family N-acetyltransferase [Acuticoccus sediminis]
MHKIEEATPGDAPRIAEVLTRSIRDLCAADHHDDPGLVTRWTANKTRENVLEWIMDPALAVLVSRDDGDIAAVGMIRGDTILLNYVAPGRRFTGHSKALLGAMEEHIRSAGYPSGRLESTVTAHRFYTVHGWYDIGPPTGCGGLTCQPMAKDVGEEKAHGEV